MTTRVFLYGGIVMLMGWIAPMGLAAENALLPTYWDTHPTMPENDPLLDKITGHLKNSPQDFETKEITLSRLRDGSFGMNLVSNQEDPPFIIVTSNQPLCQEGDVIIQANGTLIVYSTLTKLIELFATSGDSITLTLLRKKPDLE